ncbi:hypothetical protein Pmani_023687 [Petrolisthes manimaculis]|uniref:Uncharacterized protein n=1 Tax=Petrolisthes manimaculis TaxID=1843537 RepID=A0AAE1P9E0_9EUCA|nr:hypothetical protein Pmani_023687 [Petrolisthes manimaculis]
MVQDHKSCAGSTTNKYNDKCTIIGKMEQSQLDCYACDAACRRQEVKPSYPKRDRTPSTPRGPVAFLNGSVTAFRGFPPLPEMSHTATLSPVANSPVPGPSREAASPPPRARSTSRLRECKHESKRRSLLSKRTHTRCRSPSLSFSYATLPDP